MGSDVFRRLLEIWRRPARAAQAEDPARLGLIIILLFVTGVFINSLNFLRGDFQPIHLASLVSLILLIPLYLLNRAGRFHAALALTIIWLIVLAALSLLALDATRSFIPLYYLILAILVTGLFLPFRLYTLVTGVAVATGFIFSFQLPNRLELPGLELAFSLLLGLVIYHERSEDTAGAIQRVQTSLGVSTRSSSRLTLLEEVARQVTDSLDETEILQKTLEAVVDKFGYAEAAICLIVGGDTVEVKAIAGTEDVGIHPGYSQKLGIGIVGHVAETGETYLTPDVSKDKYYFSTAPRNGSAVGIPILDHEQVLGVLYMEDNARNAFTPEDIQTIQAITTQVAISLQKARLYTRTRQHLRTITTLQSVSDALTSSLDLNEIFQTVIQLLQTAFGYTYVSIYLLDGDILRLGAQLGYPENLIIREVSTQKGVMGRAARTGHTQFIRDVGKDPDFLRASSDVQSEISVPLLRDEHVLGVLNVESSVLLGPYDMDLLNTLAGPVAIAIENARLHSELKQLAWTDALSGLANRRAFDSMLEAEIARAQRYDHPLSLIIMDLDSFKEYNDRWGHLAGDERLKQLAAMLRQAVREPDITARHGGEEFAALLPDTGKEGALVLAERLRLCAEAQSPTPNRRQGPISGYTISIGVASYPQDAIDARELLLAADNAELTAKRMGKNRVFSR